MFKKEFNREYKLQAVKLVVEENVSVSSASKLLNVSQSSLYRWIQEYEKYGDKSFPGRGTPIYNQMYKLKVLEKENEALKTEIKLLKKYRAFLKQKKK